MYQDKVYVFGGEYATLDQFYHYKDMWALDLKTNVWEELPVSKVNLTIVNIVFCRFVLIKLFLSSLLRMVLLLALVIGWLCGEIALSCLVDFMKLCVR